MRLKVSDVSDRELLLQEPKSGKEEEVAFMPEQVAKRLDEYIHREALAPRRSTPLHLLFYSKILG